MIKTKKDTDEMIIIDDEKSVSQSLKMDDILITEERVTFQPSYHLLYHQAETICGPIIGLELQETLDKMTNPAQALIQPLSFQEKIHHQAETICGPTIGLELQETLDKMTNSAQALIQPLPFQEKIHHQAETICGPTIGLELQETLDKMTNSAQALIQPLPFQRRTLSSI